MAGETGIANSTITAVLKGGREMTRREIDTIARYFRTPPALFLPGNARSRRSVRLPANPRTGGRARSMSRTGPVGRHRKSEPGTRGRKSRSPKIGATVRWSNLGRTAKATSALLDGERLPGPAGGEGESGDGTAA